jgi:mannosylglycerate synthase
LRLVVFPFKSEGTSVVAANLDTAASHPRVSEVWAVAASPDNLMQSVGEVADLVASAHRKPVTVFPQERIGRFREGKGDGMNTAIDRAAGEGFERVHFYDADITNFDHTWLDGAEAAADEGFQVVRHSFPRAATDAMVTWMITRPALALTFPDSLLPRLGQPLGGELLLGAGAVRHLRSEPMVRDRSDWGIDTMITYATGTMGVPVYQHVVPSGKRHALYGSLDEIRPMVVECLDAVRSLRDLPAPAAELVSAPPAPVPEDLKRIVGYDREPSVALLTAPWTAGEEELALGLPVAVDEVLANRVCPSFEFMDAATWGSILDHLLVHFRLGDEDWEGLAFRLWLMRVLSYTTEHASRGYDHAIDYLEGTIRGYRGS